MGSHADYGNKVLLEATNGLFEQYGPAVEIDYGAGLPARIDGVVDNSVAVEIESRVSKQVRGAVLDLICHRCPNKLLILVPVHMQNPEVTAAQCENVLARFCDDDKFRVIVLEGTGNDPHHDIDATLVAAALRQLRA
jgi:hypothetical protein